MQPARLREQFGQHAVLVTLFKCGQVDVRRSILADADERQRVLVRIDEQRAGLSVLVELRDDLVVFRQRQRIRLDGDSLDNRLEGQDQSGADDEQQWNCKEKRNPAMETKEIGFQHGNGLGCCSATLPPTHIRIK